MEDLHDGIAVGVSDRLVNARIEDTGACGIGIKCRVVGAAVNHGLGQVDLTGIDTCGKSFRTDNSAGCAIVVSLDNDEAGSRKLNGRNINNVARKLVGDDDAVVRSDR